MIAGKALLFDEQELCTNYLFFIERAQLVAKDPVAVAEWFHTTLNHILDALFGRVSEKQYKFRSALFGKFSAYYGTIEDQKRGALHGHLAGFLVGLSPDEVQRVIVSEDLPRLLRFIESIISECLPLLRPEDLTNNVSIGGTPCPDPQMPDFDEFFPRLVGEVVHKVSS